MGRKNHYEDWQLEYIVAHWAEKTSAIAKATGLSEKTISRLAMERFHLPKKKTGYNETEGLNVGGHHYKFLTQEKLDLIVANKEMLCSDLAEMTGLSLTNVSGIIRSLNLRERYWSHRLPKTSDVVADLSNPFLSHVELAQKYHVHETTVGHRRNELGLGVRTKNYDTLIEQKVARLLDELDVAYIKQRQIGPWSLDFYLGDHRCLDIHGTWAHDKDSVMERDARKAKDLDSKGYRYLVVKEEQLVDEENVKSMLNRFLMGSLRP